MKKSATKVTYEYHLNEIKQLFAEHLKVPVNEIKVEYIIEEKQAIGGYYDPRDNNSYSVVTGVKVTRSTTGQ